MNASVTYPSLDNSQIANIAACSVVYGLAIVCTAISIYNKARRKVLYVIDDGLMILAVISLTGELAGYLYSIKLGFGKHMETLSVTSITTIYKVFYILEILYMFTVVAAKISLSMMIYRIFHADRSTRIISIILIVLTVCYLVVALGVTIFQCIPVEKAWSDPSSNTPGSCMNLKAIYLGIAIPNIGTDFVLTLLPIYYVMGMQMTTGNKFKVCLVFSVGSIVTISSMLRPRPQLWSFIETGMGIAISTGSPLIMQLGGKLLNFQKSSLGRRMNFTSNRTAREDTKLGRPESMTLPVIAELNKSGQYSIENSDQQAWPVKLYIFGSLTSRNAIEVWVQQEVRQDIVEPWHWV
ncbi:putative integral membrane protein [Botrytis fragariae]|uniref:Putative integral membrane protein n=1 Tax=Botrytis fragariae TaxID=1964551 RepID=A0A8H6EI38_9HELO|nr:putative integral membrane protein [Botrytis fragariae]KAF5873031.1 putative integral membrane protein [Botrytis fragariae]